MIDTGDHAVDRARQCRRLLQGHRRSGGAVVTDYKRVIEVARRLSPRWPSSSPRRGWAKIVSDTGSMQMGVTGIDVRSEPKFASVLQLVSGKLDDLAEPGTI
jgi:hypothetical protein